MEQQMSGYGLTFVLGIAFGCWMGAWQSWQHALRLRRFGIEPSAWESDRSEPAALSGVCQACRNWRQSQLGVATE